MTTAAHSPHAQPVFEAMLDGWTRQQRAGSLPSYTVQSRLDLVYRFAVYTDRYPWEWEPGQADAFLDHLLSAHLRSAQRPIGLSTISTYRLALRLFLEYVTDPRHAWLRECQEKFGRVPVPIPPE
ncbi:MULTISPECIES: integrase [unclassified Streptomyces]|uniref:integrase n=2 Tax=unclassified Streptomyces TaxID=2593676 RepID=UPI0031BA4E04